MSKFDQKISQPKPLYFLAGTELWERVGFYTVQGMLIFLITSYFKIPDAQAALLTGTFGALVFITPIIGGLFADKVLGFRWTVLLGAVLMCLGYLLISTLNTSLFYWGLASVILGNGFLKPNLASFLGVFYTEDDIRRQAGFTYYYMIANIGSILATLMSGYLHIKFNWHVVFLVPAAGIGVGIITFFLGFAYFETAGQPPAIQYIREKTTQFVLYTIGLCLVIAGVAFALLRHANVGDSIIIIVGVITLCYLIFIAMRYQKRQRQHFFALIILITFSVVFWAIFFEIFSAVGLFTDRSVDRHLFGYTIPSIWFVGLESFFILVIGAPLAALWKYLSRIHKNPNIAAKFGFALLVIAGGMWLLSYALNHPNAQGLVYAGWLVIFYLLITTSEMLLSPNLISAVTELSPQKELGMMMGVQYMAIGFGSSITGRLAEFAAIPKGVTDLKSINQIYHHAFNLYAIVAIAAGVLILMISPWIKRLIEQGTV